MEYTALYRKFRPLKFDEIVGQEHIVRTLKNELINDRVGHAYLFNGGRGTGKTSAAKILARAVNCLNPKDGEPCNECAVCKAALEGSLTDIVEMDAASNNSVEDVRAIRDEVNFLPTVAKYRVYIIDEVHMLSTGAFNALLKTLEEPPAHVKFILATTEPQKLPATILSRCQRFDFKRVSSKDIASRMSYICKKENIEAEEKALSLIARNSQGALRDALSILDQCISFGNEKIEYNDVIELLGTVNIDELFELSQSIIDENTKKSLEILNEFIIWGKDIRNLINDLIDHFRNLMVCKVSKDLDEIISLPEESIERLKEQSQNVNINDLIRILNILSETQDSMKSSSNTRILAEVTIMKIAQPMFDESKEALIKRIENLEEKIESGNIKVSTVQIEQSKDVKSQIIEDNKVEENKEDVAYEEVKSEDVRLVESSWKKITQKIKDDRKLSVAALLKEVNTFNVKDNILYLIFNDNFSFARSRLNSKETIEYIESIIREVLNRSFNIQIYLKSEVASLNLSETINKADEGEEILKNIVNKDILEIKDSIEK